jgi:hypothetical protein
MISLLFHVFQGCCPAQSTGYSWISDMWCFFLPPLRFLHYLLSIHGRCHSQWPFFASAGKADLNMFQAHIKHRCKWFTSCYHMIFPLIISRRGDFLFVFDEMLDPEKYLEWASMGLLTCVLLIRQWISLDVLSVTIVVLTFQFYAIISDCYPFPLISHCMYTTAYRVRTANVLPSRWEICALLRQRLN